MKNFFREHGQKVFIVFLTLFTLFCCFYEFPYYIDAPGGTDNINNKVTVEGGYKSEGSFNLTYVSEIKAILPLLIIAKIHPDWKIEKKQTKKDSIMDYDEIMDRQKVLVKQSYTTAIKYAYEKANKDVKVTKENCYIIYVFDEAETDLKIGDQLLEVDNTKLNKCSDISDIKKKKKLNDTSEFKILRNGKEYTKKAKFKTIQNIEAYGVQIGTEYIMETNPKYELKYSGREYGPSGGLMVSLAVYNSLVEEDITKGKKIAGTGTLDVEGNVGAIGGVEFKLKGAVKNKADVFLVPSGENYEDAIKLKEKRKYKIDIVEVKTFDDALKYLENL